MAVQAKARPSDWSSGKTTGTVTTSLEDRAYELSEYRFMMQDRWRADEATTLTHGEQRKLEIAILLGLDPEILLLDEPTAGMSLEEVPAILDLIRRRSRRRATGPFYWWNTSST